MAHGVLRSVDLACSCQAYKMRRRNAWQQGVYENSIHQKIVGLVWTTEAQQQHALSGMEPSNCLCFKGMSHLQLKAKVLARFLLQWYPYVAPHASISDARACGINPVRDVEPHEKITSGAARCGLQHCCSTDNYRKTQHLRRSSPS